MVRGTRREARSAWAQPVSASSSSSFSHGLGTRVMGPVLSRRQMDSWSVISRTLKVLSSEWPAPHSRCPAAGMGHGPSDLTSLDDFAERFAVGIFTDEAWVQNMRRVAW